MKTLTLLISLNFFTINNPSYNIWITEQRLKVLRNPVSYECFFRQLNSIFYNVVMGYKKQQNLLANKYVFEIKDLK